MGRTRKAAAARLPTEVRRIGTLPAWFRRAARITKCIPSKPAYRPLKRAALRRAADSLTWPGEESISYEAEVQELLRSFALRRALARRALSGTDLAAALLALKFEKTVALAAIKERRAARAFAARQERRRRRAQQAMPQP